MDYHEQDPLVAGTPTAGREELFMMQMIVVAMIFGVGIFAALIVGLHLSGALGSETYTDTDLSLVNLLSTLNIVAVCTAVLFALLIPPRLLKRKLRPLTDEIAEGTEQQDSPEAFKKFLEAYCPAGVVRLAALEGASLYGLVVCLIAVGSGALEEQPLYWTNAVPGVLFIMYAGMVFPTRHRLEAILARKLREMRGAL